MRKDEGFRLKVEGWAIFVFCLLASAFGDSVTVKWPASADSNVVASVVYYGPLSRPGLTNRAVVVTGTNAANTNLTIYVGTNQFWFTVTYADALGRESAPAPAFTNAAPTVPSAPAAPTSITNL